MPQTILPSYTYSTDVARYRSTETGRFTARRDIINLLETHVDSAERRLGELTTAYFEGNISPSTFQVTMRDELRQLHSQQRALGAGGWDRMDNRAWGSVGGRLGGFGGDYERMTNLARDIANGEVTLPQALNRINGYVGNSRIQFWEAEREAARQTGRMYEERRRLGNSEHCSDCVDYAAQGYQPLDTLPPPGIGSICSTHCRCTLERKEVTL